MSGATVAGGRAAPIRSGIRAPSHGRIGAARKTSRAPLFFPRARPLAASRMDF